MVPDAGWRSSALYLHVDGLAASDIAWGWLRRKGSMIMISMRTRAARKILNR